MAIEVTQAGATDRGDLMGLLAEMAANYTEAADTPLLARAAETLTDPQGEAGPFCLLAWEGGAALAFAALLRFYPARDLTWGLSLKDLFVSPRARGGVAAPALITATAGFALAGGYSRVDWTTDGTNARARAFYGRLGAPVADKLFYRLEGEALREAASGRWPGREGRQTS